ncbi:DUF6876 family protein [Chryseobacterium herbae]|uniref:DUF6876 domain-containing protein n=1 Tax=Chryseobacterium herbae TaxID=2976476 RepID=A0ABT2IXF7_9FLAO|nr:DUF6876 family protein [Chryseobacterium sp. pc1-10]MCT2563382.1 hypothetical protein [Chryseobacterium sp. pc1-10]
MKKNSKIENCANNLYNEFPKAEVFIKYAKKINVSEGILYVAEQEECHWFLDIMVQNCIMVSEIKYQKWKLLKNPDGEILVVALDRKCNRLLEINVPEKDFYFSSLTICKISNNLLMPCEQ